MSLEQVKSDIVREESMIIENNYNHKMSKSSRRKTVDRSLKKIIAPFCKVIRRGFKSDIEDNSFNRDVAEFQIFLTDNIDFTKLLFDTADILKISTQSTGVMVYLVDRMRNEIYLKPHHMVNVERHKVNWPISEGKTLAAHAASTKQFVIVEDVSTDKRFSEGVTWPDAKTALCLPVVQPDNSCYAVLELYRTNDDPYYEDQLRSAQCCTGWVGAAVHQANQRISLEQKLHLNKELLNLLMQYFSDQVNLDKMIFEILSISKHCLRANRATIYIIDSTYVGDPMTADMYDESWDSSIPKKKVKISLSNCDTPPGLAANSGEPVNVKDLYSDERFHKEVDPVTGSIVRSVLCLPLKSKNGIIGVISVINKYNEEIFTTEDIEFFSIISHYCRQVVQYFILQKKYLAMKNLNTVYGELLQKHMNPCIHNLDSLIQYHVTLLPDKFDEFEWYIQSDCRDRIPELMFYMINKLSGGVQFDRMVLSTFILTVLEGYRDNPYHNSEHAFTFTHTMYNIIMRNAESFTKIEMIALMIGGFCHDLDHPGLNNSFLIESKHPLAAVYTDSILENHHFFLTRKILLDKGVLSDLTSDEQQEVLKEIKFNIMCTDLAIHFRLRSELAPLVANKKFDDTNPEHRNLTKSIMMTSCDLAVQGKPFHIVKKITEHLYEEFYAQGDLEREMGYAPLSMMDRTKSFNQATEQIHFLQIVVLPCLLLLQAIVQGTSQMTDYCMQAQESWQELNDLRGKKLWVQVDSYSRMTTTLTKRKSSSSPHGDSSEKFS